uniref:Metalloendopeptidase n=1 Tax=Strongyloides stercoralis TaxID=6248 RepID=A0A0K0ENW7_STRER
MTFLRFILLYMCIIILSHSLSNSFLNKNSFQKSYDKNETLTKREVDESQDSELFEESVDRDKRYIKQSNFFKWVIPYYIDYNVDVNTVEKVFQILQAETCLHFRRVFSLSEKVPGIKFSYDDKCKINYNSLYKNKKTYGVVWQNITVNNDCYKMRYLFQEVLHILGMIFEHQRKCRDRYILFKRYNWGRFKDLYFQMVPHSNMMDAVSSSYDYGSIMQPELDFYSNGKGKTMIPVVELFSKTMGQNNYPSFLDIKRLNFYYCSTKCSKKLRCFNDGYLDPTNCITCRCIPGFEGSFCEKFQRPTFLCKRTVFEAKYKSEVLADAGDKECNYLIRAPRGRRVLISLLYLFIKPEKKKSCYPSNSLEIKYWNDKAPTGLRLCGLTSNINLMSRGESVIIYFKSNDTNNKFFLRYKAH